MNNLFAPFAYMAQGAFYTTSYQSQRAHPEKSAILILEPLVKLVGWNPRVLVAIVG